MNIATLCGWGVLICIIIFVAFVLISYFSMNAKMGKIRIIQDGNGKFVVQMVQHHSWDWEAMEKPDWLPVNDKKYDTLEEAQNVAAKISAEVKKHEAADIIQKVWDVDSTLI